MNCEQFLKSLSQDLADMAPREREDILADYAEYFSDAVAAGRSEADVAKALGTPKQLARQLRAQARIKDWQENRSAKTFTRLFAAVLALSFMNLMVLPLLIGLGATLLATFAVAIGLIVAGVVLMLTMVPSLPLLNFLTVDVAGVELTEPVGMMLAGVGLACAGIVWLMVDAWFARWFAQGLIGYARLNFRLARNEWPGEA